MTGDTAGAPRDPAGLVEILDELGSDGYTGQWSAVEGGSVRCGACGQASRADELDPVALRRTEGASDPGDMAAVVALACRHCGTKGALVLRFGPEAGTADAEVLSALRR